MAAAIITEAEAAATLGSNRRERDEVYWTELEFRRLGNMVAEMIQARRYVGESPQAAEERALMKSRLQAMHRKALRILERAEVFAKSGHNAWPGLDPNLTEPVSLAEEYVRTVTNYEAVLAEEEDRPKKPAKDEINVGSARMRTPPELPVQPEDGSVLPSLEDIADLDGKTDSDISYREALRREGMDSESAERDELLQGGLRKRREDLGESASSTKAFSKDDEELMKRHQAVEDELTSDLVKLVGELKGSISTINDKIKGDDAVLDETEDALDRNINGITRQRGNLDGFTRSKSLSWWTIWALVFVVVVVFVFVLALTQVPI